MPNRSFSTRSWAAAALLLLAAGARPARGQEPAAAAPVPPPRLALVLGGGGARGIAHIGALRALEEAGVPVDAITANSMGAIVGSIYATGRTADEMERVVRSLDWASLFSGRYDRRTREVAKRVDRYASLTGVDLGWKGPHLPEGALAEHRVNRFLIEHLAPAGYAAEGDFDRLPIRFRAVAAALDDGSRVVLARGDLARAVRASMSVPVFFPPVEWEGRRLVDGLLVDNLPVGLARDLGAAVVVAVDVGSPDLEPEEYRSALGVAAQVSSLLTKRSNVDLRQAPDVLVRPDLGKHSTTDYSDLDTLIQQGFLAMQAALPEIQRRLAAAGPAPGAGPPAAPPAPPRRLDGTPIAEVVVRGNDRLTERLVRRTFNIPVGPGFILARGLRAFDKVQASGLLERSWMTFEAGPAGLRVVLQVQEAVPNRAEVGLAFTTWDKTRGSIRLRNRNTLRFGEETELLAAASDSEAIAQLGLRGDRLFVAGFGYRLRALALDDKPRVFDADGKEINRARYEHRLLDVTLQWPLERWGLLEAGLRGGRVTTQPRPGLDSAESSDDVATLYAGLAVDTLDDLLWPEAGARVAGRAEWSTSDLRADRDFWRARLEARVGKHLARRVVLQADVLAGLSGRDLPVYEQFRLGGPYLLPGYAFDQLWGPQALAGSLAVRYRLLGPLRVFARGGAGNVFAAREDVTLSGLRWGVGAGVVIPSRVGPLAGELGVRDGGDTIFSVSLGWN